MSLVCSVPSNDRRSRLGSLYSSNHLSPFLLCLVSLNEVCVHFKWLLLPPAIGVYFTLLFCAFVLSAIFFVGTFMKGSLCQFCAHRLLPSEAIWKYLLDSEAKLGLYLFLLSAVSVVSLKLSPSLSSSPFNSNHRLSVFAFQFAFYIFASKDPVVLFFCQPHSPFVWGCWQSANAAKTMTFLI